MKPIDHCLNHNRFIPINTEELTALELIGKTVEKTNEVVEKANEIDKLANDNKKNKVSHSEMLNDYKNNKGDHVGSWHGIERPEYSEPGIASVVIKNSDDIVTLKKRYESIKVSVKEYGAIGDGITDDTLAFKKALDYLNNVGNGTLTIPTGEYLLNKISLNKNKASKIIIEGQTQKTDYWNVLNETVVLKAIDSDIFEFNNITINIIGVSFVGNNKGIGIVADKGGRLSFHNSKVYGFSVGLDLKNIIHDIRESEITGNNVGVSLYNSGDSSIVDCWINTNIVGISYLQYCANSQIKGGKIEWNEKGILTLSSGLIVSGIQFDFNKFFDISIEGGTFNKYCFAVHPDNIFSISINNNRFLGSGYTDVEISQSGSCNIWAYKCSEINITGNTFTTSGRHAFDNSGLSSKEPQYKVAPVFAFIKMRDSMINCTGNTFNTQYAIPPVVIVDVNKIASKLQYTGNTHTTDRTPFIYDFGGVDISGTTNRIYSTIGNTNVSKCNKKPTHGNFQYGDIINNGIPTSIQKWLVIEGGTLRESKQVNYIATSGKNYFELTDEIDVNHLQVGDLIVIEYEAKKVIRIVYNDGENVYDKPRFYVNGVVPTSSGPLKFYPPQFREIT